MNCEFCEKNLQGPAVVIGANYVVHTGCEHGFRAAMRGLHHRCPKCKTTGKVDHPHHLVRKNVKLAPDEVPDCAYGGCMGCGMCRSGLKTIEVPQKVTCDLCKGEGYLPREPTPVRAVVDWKL